LISPRQILDFQINYTTFPQSNQGGALYITNSEGIAYHQAAGNTAFG
jgi:hypothetical protein